ncbi:Copper amine oxidase N-terminal domain-containing protein [Fontibacillus panacisegetis]|uniref:Copper amine oxidase N-terminal domain-containing protein n=1 Tax=Fontibacillus panacisegetis TaxID=670482 RepID=A0A1G7RE16_9BACL|nr:copper amine oxidase N-terminal domain-containing protein [Fontibacillus panacisegetis]SDG08419.1 Copper amine oxidase N-terminal domain-containing protein [Fontibacillus panacisegetis]
MNFFRFSKCIFVLVFIIGVFYYQSNFADASRQNPSIYVGNTKLDIDASVTYNGTTLVPFRAIFEEFGMKVAWDTENKSVTATNENFTIILTNNSHTAYVNDKEYQLTQVPSLSRDGSLVVNLRFIAEILGREVVWEKTDTDAIIYISSQ